MSRISILQISCLTRTVAKARWSIKGAVAGNHGINIQAGRVTALTGPPGVGTSEILRTIYHAHMGGTGRLIYRQRSGVTVQLSELDDDARLDLREREFGFAGGLHNVPSNTSLIDYLTREIRAGGTQAQEAREVAIKTLLKFGFAQNLLKSPSAWMQAPDQHRAGLARVFAKRPRLALLDEPERHLTAEQMEALEAEIRHLKQIGTGILIATRNTHLLTHAADEVIPLPATASEEEIAPKAT